jgi:hypothetical protein
MPGLLARLGATFVHSTVLIDRAYLRLDRFRSLMVLAFASDDFLEAHCKLAYDATSAYRADSPDFRRELFSWERRAVRDFFPGPPARVLLGGAGGGREAYALIEMGYTVLAFDPASELAASMKEKARVMHPGKLDAYCAAYEDLPLMPAPSSEGGPVDLRTLPTFDAAILGWCSFSHLIEDSARVAALAGFAALTSGPILVSYFSDQAQVMRAPTGGGLINALRRRAFRRGASMFTTAIGYARLLTEAEVRDIVERAGLEVVHLDRDGEFPYAILRR